MIGGREAQIGAPDTPAAAGEPAERGGRAFVQQVAVYIEERVTARALGNHVPGPDLLEHGARCTHAQALSRAEDYY